MKRLSEMKVGDTLTLKRFVDQYRPLFYAGAGNDFNPVHTDPEFGKLAGFGGNILHGMCTYAFALSAATRLVDDPGAVKRVKARFKKPVRLGQTILCTATVTAIEGKTVKMEITARNDQGEDVLAGASAEAELED